MARNTHKIGFAASVFALLVLTAYHSTTQVRGAGEKFVKGKISEETQACLAESEPAAFLVVEIRSTAEGGISLSWSDLGSSYGYTVEFTQSLTEGQWDLVPPVDQWPSTETTWSDTWAAGLPIGFYRIRPEALFGPPSPPTDVTATVADGEVVISWSPVPGATSYNLYWSTEEKFSPLEANKTEGVTSPFTHTELAFGATRYYVLTAVGEKGESEVSRVVTASRAPLLDLTVATTMAAATEFLYTGDNPIQTGVDPGTIEPRRVAVLRGKALTLDGEPLSGANITVLSHPEYGQTLSRGDGMFDLAVNGGGYLTVDYQKEGYLPAQRQVNVPWQDYVWLPDVVLIPLDAEVTVIDFSEPMQAAQGSVVTDECGPRQATVLFSQGTQAEMVMPDGSTQPISTLSIRATEYTVGDNGPEAMPAELPPNSGYTYCVEFTADEAVAAGAKDVQLDQPVINYVENFLSAEVGSIVPVGYYDRTKGAWIPSDNGLVIEILSINDGLAELDIDGTGQPADAQALADLGITDDERQRLAALYQAGQSLWRVPITHFTPWDFNWPFGPPEDAVDPDQPPPEREQPEDDPCKEAGGSIIETQNQVLGEAVDVTGTPFTLHYRSGRVPGRTAARTLKISLSGPTVPESLVGIELEIHVAGQVFTHSVGRDHPCLLQRPSLGPYSVPGGLAAPMGEFANRDLTPQDATTDLTNQSYTFVWDGKDAYGRTLQGSQPVTVRIGYVYCGVYLDSRPGPEYDRTFGHFSYYGIPITGSRTRQEVTLWQEWETWIGQWDARRQGLGAWTLDVHHTYDPSGKVLYLGDGRRRSAESLPAVITTVAGNGTCGYSGDGGPATEAQIGCPTGIAVGPDGSLYIADSPRVRRVGPDGIITTMAGNGTPGYSGDGGPATQAGLSPHELAVGPDGSLYIGDTRNNRVRRVGPDGIITTVAGNGTEGYSGDGGPATEAQIEGPYGIAVAPDRTLYVTQHGWDGCCVRRVGLDGIITRVAGTGGCGPYSGEGGPATQAQFVPIRIALGPDGTLYIAQSSLEAWDWRSRILRVWPDGIITTLAGTGTFGHSGDGGLATEAQIGDADEIAVGPDGSVYFAEYWYEHVRANGFWNRVDYERVRRVGPDGIITTVAGGRRGYGAPGDGGPALQAGFWIIGAPALGQDGSLYIADVMNYRVRRVAPPLPGSSLGDVVIAAEDGSEVYVFDPSGRHLRTQDALTGAVIFRFTYNNAGRLAQIEDADGNITTIERDANGDPTAIVSPYGQRTALSLDANGYLASITDPLGNPVQLTYSSDGLLRTFTDPKGATYRYGYDAVGRLSTAEDPAGGYKTLTRADTDNGYEVTVETALGRTATYRVERLSTGEKRLTNTFCCGKQNEVLVGTDGRSKMTLADGTAIDVVQGPDPRWGIQAPVASNAISTTPEGRQLAVETTRDVTLSDPNDPLSLETLSGTLSINGRTYSSVYEAGSRTFTDTTPEGRQSTTTIDAQGRVIEMQEAGLVPASYSYDTNGRLTSITSGAGAEARTICLTYSSDGYLTTITDPLGRTASFGYDAAGRVTEQTQPDGEMIHFSYDANGNVTSITPPARPAHTFAYTAVDLLSTYTPPDVGAGSSQAVYTYDADGQVTSITLADGHTVGLNYDDAGRLSTLTLPRGQVAYSYDATTGRLHTITTPDGGTLSYGYDGSLLAAETWTGAVAGSVTYTYDNDFRITSISVNGGNTIAFQYNGDSELTQVGELVVTRDPQNGLVTSTAVRNITESWGYNGFGEPVSHSAAHNGTDLYIVQYTRDKLGRITEKTETISGASDIFNYTCDAAGRLTEVKKDDITIATYTYDGNGNRLSRTGAGGTVSGTYDDQDRLLQYGATTYTYTANGDLLAKTSQGQTTTYEYDALGNLIAVGLGDGTEIEYLVDGDNRRIGKKVNGALVQGFLYLDPVNPIAELDGAGNLVSLFTYATQGNLPAYTVKDDTTYRIISDHLGSPRLVVNTDTGEIVQRMDYDEFGKVIMDTNPAFQPFGFAGGIYDRHTKLVRFGARDYDAQTGRWTSRDPLLFEGGQNNLYVYVDNDPINQTDPLGTDWLAKRIRDMLKRLRKIAPDSAEQARKAAEEAAKQRRPPPPPPPKPKPPPSPTPRKKIPRGERGFRGKPIPCLYPWIIIDPQLLKEAICEKMPMFPGCPPSSWHAWRQRQIM